MKKSIVLTLIALSASVFAEIAAPWGGSLSVKGNGKFVCRDAKMALQPGKSYRFDFKMSKVAPLSKKNIEHQLVLYSVDNGKHNQQYLQNGKNRLRGWHGWKTPSRPASS